MPKNSGPTHIRLALWDFCVAEARAAIQQKTVLERELRQGTVIVHTKETSGVVDPTMEIIEKKRKIDELNGYIDGMRSMMVELKQGIRDALDEEQDEL